MIRNEQLVSKIIRLPTFKEACRRAPAYVQINPYNSSKFFYGIPKGVWRDQLEGRQAISKYRPVDFKYGRTDIYVIQHWYVPAPFINILSHEQGVK